jgi:hypothetical protein
LTNDWPFSVVSVWELADGVLVTHDNEDEYCAYFVRAAWKCTDADLDRSHEISHFPSDYGMMEVLTAQSLEQMVLACHHYLQGGSWHPEPLLVAGVN